MYLLLNPKTAKVVKSLHTNIQSVTQSIKKKYFISSRSHNIKYHIPAMIINNNIPTVSKIGFDFEISKVNGFSDKTLVISFAKACAIAVSCTVLIDDDDDRRNR